MKYILFHTAQIGRPRYWNTERGWVSDYKSASDLSAIDAWDWVNTLTLRGFKMKWEVVL